MDARYAKMLSKFLEEFRVKVRQLPSPQLLPLASTADLEARMLAAPDVFSLNRVFWADQLASLEAWRAILAWRMAELLEVAVALREDDKMLACAPVARAALELAQTSLVTSARLCKVLDQIGPEILRDQVCFSESFPDDIEQALYGTTIMSRVGCVGVQRPPKLVKSRKLLQDLKEGGEISKYYEKISDISHPYWLGNRPFYRLGNANTLEQVSREYDALWAEEIGEDLNTMLAWTAKAASNVMDQTALSLSRMRKAINVE